MDQSNQLLFYMPMPLLEDSQAASIKLTCGLLCQEDNGDIERHLGGSSSDNIVHSVGVCISTVGALALQLTIWEYRISFVT